MTDVVELDERRVRHANLEGLEPVVDDDGLVTFRLRDPCADARGVVGETE